MFKKILFSDKNKLKSNSFLLTYTPPILHRGKDWYIDFLALVPATGKMKRKKYMLNRIPQTSIRLAYANELMANLFDQLRSGWSPWVKNPGKRNFLKFDDILTYYISNIDKLYSAGSIKYNTLLDYDKRVRLLRKYNSNLSTPIVYIYQFDSVYISNFLDYILVDRDSSTRIRNNYKTWLSSFGNWCVERGWVNF